MEEFVKKIMDMSRYHMRKVHMSKRLITKMKVENDNKEFNAVAGIPVFELPDYVPDLFTDCIVECEDCYFILTVDGTRMMMFKKSMLRTSAPVGVKDAV